MKPLAYMRKAECFLLHITCIFDYYLREFQELALKTDNSCGFC
jgi:hypothetical protein